MQPTQATQPLLAIPPTTAALRITPALATTAALATTPALPTVADAADDAGAPHGAGAADHPRAADRAGAPDHAHALGRRDAPDSVAVAAGARLAHAGAVRHSAKNFAAIWSTVPLVRIVIVPSTCQIALRSRSESLMPPLGSQ